MKDDEMLPRCLSDALQVPLECGKAYWVDNGLYPGSTLVLELAQAAPVAVTPATGARAHPCNKNTHLGSISSSFILCSLISCPLIPYYLILYSLTNSGSETA